MCVYRVNNVLKKIDFYSILIRNEVNDTTAHCIQQELLPNTCYDIIKNLIYCQDFLAQPVGGPLSLNILTIFKFILISLFIQLGQLPIESEFLSVVINPACIIFFSRSFVRWRARAHTHGCYGTVTHCGGGFLENNRLYCVTCLVPPLLYFQIVYLFRFYILFISYFVVDICCFLKIFRKAGFCAMSNIYNTLSYQLEKLFFFGWWGKNKIWVANKNEHFLFLQSSRF